MKDSDWGVINGAPVSRAGAQTQL